MTPYGREDLAEDWEFKILRSMTGAFKDPAKMQRFLDEEARAGWVLVEKFDNSRIRLKRPASKKGAHPELDFDPYRTYVGPSEGQYVLLVVVGTLAGIAVVGGLIAGIAALAR